jgi:hydroxymethylpyrimidine/phosphomethylpyrimidine kinase
LKVSVPLSIAGSDPSAGAGLELDLKVFTCHGLHGTAVATCLTEQTSRQLFHLRPLPFAPAWRRLQQLMRDVPIGAAKIGMLPDRAWLEGLARRLPQIRLPWIVLDPICGPTRGRSVHGGASRKALQRLLPRVDLLTPNLSEAAAILGCEVQRVRRRPDACLQELLQLGPRAVLLKGGHGRGPQVIDRLRGEWGSYDHVAERIPGPSPRGTGCALSAAVTVHLSQGSNVVESILRARRFLREAIQYKVRIGRGRPLLGLVFPESQSEN